MSTTDIWWWAFSAAMVLAGSRAFYFDWIKEDRAEAAYNVAWLALFYAMWKTL